MRAFVAAQAQAARQRICYRRESARGFKRLRKLFHRGVAEMPIFPILFTQNQPEMPATA
jgi:hypothetical protein